MNRNHVFWIFVGFLSLLYLNRYNISWGPSYATYDISVIDTTKWTAGDSLAPSDLYTGEYRFMAGAFEGRAMNIGITSNVPDSAWQVYNIIGCNDSDKYGRCMDPRTHMEREYKKSISLKSKLPARSIGQKYHLIFTRLPHGSISLRVETRDLNDCRHIYDLPGMPGIPAIAIVGPCDCCSR